MRNKYLLLLKMQLYNFFGINRMLHSHSKKEKQKSMLLGALAIVILGLMITYSALFSAGLAGMGAASLLPTLSVCLLWRAFKIYPLCSSNSVIRPACGSYGCSAIVKNVSAT